MQRVFWGPKRRVLEVPQGWAFVKDGEPVRDSDEFFNMMTHRWASIDSVGGSLEGGVQLCTGPDEAFEVVIRERNFFTENSLDPDPDSSRVVECL